MSVHVGATLRLRESRLAYKVLVLTVDETTAEVQSLLASKACGIVCRRKKFPHASIYSPQVERVQDDQEVVKLKGQTEMQVPVSSLEPLEAFEVDVQPAEASPIAQVERLKVEARVLFGKKDFSAAASWYRQALELFEEHFSWRRNEKGETSVVVRVGGYVSAATLLGRRDAAKSVLVSPVGDGKPPSSNGGGGDSDDEDDEILVCAHADVLATVAPLEAGQLQCSLYLNVAKCYLALEAPRRALWPATIALRIAALRSSQVHGAGAPDWAREVCCTSLFIRAKAFLADGAPGALAKAKREASLARDAKPDQREVLALLAEIQRQEEVRRRADRQLARNIGEWADAALRIHEAGAGGSEGTGANGPSLGSSSPGAMGYSDSRDACE